MKRLVIYKTGDVPTDFSCEHIIRFTAKLYKYSERDIISTPNFIIAKVPGKTGDKTAAEKFFEMCDMVVINPPISTSFEDMEKFVDKCYVNNIDVGKSLIELTLRSLLSEESYCFY